MSKRDQPVARPLKRSEYTVVFATRAAALRWRNLLATQRSAVVDAWDELTKEPLKITANNYPLKGELGLVRHGERTHERWQHKLAGGARLWLYVDKQTVYLVEVHTRHPNQTK